MRQYTACAVLFLRVALSQRLAVDCHAIRRVFDDIASNGDDRLE
jgi:hypothetical protein